MEIELWLYFTGLADSPDATDRENSVMLESESNDWREILSCLDSLLTSPHIFIRGFPNRVEVEIHI